MLGKIRRFTQHLGALVLVPTLLCVAIQSSIPIATQASQSGALGPQQASGPMIRLAQFTFDPLQSNPKLPANLVYTEAEAGTNGSYIVQFNGPVMPEWKLAVTEAGGILGNYLPDYAFIARLSNAAKAKVAAMPFVRWVGSYQPAYKLAPAQMPGADARSYRVMLAPWADKQAVETALTAITPGVRSFGEGLAAVLDGSQLAAVSHLGDVLWVERYYLQRTYNDIGGGTIMRGSTAWSNGYTGSGMTVAIADTGLDTGFANTIHQDFAGRVTHISSWPVLYANYGGGCAISNAGANDGAGDKESGHGSHVTGSVAGSGARSSGQFKGLAYEAGITFQAVEEYTTWTTPGSSCSNGYYLSGIPDDVRTLLAEVYGWGARVQNDSWGGGAAGAYDQQAAYFDDFIHQNGDMAITVAAGNAGVDSNSDGYVDEGSVDSPATAKNVIAIGASENEHATGGYNPGGVCATWYQCWSSDYPANPTRDDTLSNNREHMAAFSSRGPTSDGRIRPDVVAPGTNIVSVRSSLATETGWGVYNTYYMYDGGTSMASPLSAGAATLVRQFYVQHEGQTRPSAALIKATLVNSAVDISGYGNSSQEAGKPIPNNHEGWGRIDVGAATTAGQRRFADEAVGVNTSATKTYFYNVTSSAQPFKISLAWSDYAGAPGAGTKLVNNLNLRVTAPNSTVYLGNVFSGGWSQVGGSADAVNNLENVYVQSPAAGMWKVEVIGQNVPQGPQPFALVVNGNITQPSLIHKLYLPVGLVPVPSAPDAPVLSAINNPGNSGNYMVAWGAANRADSYLLQEANNNSFSGAITVYSGTGLTWVANGKTPGTYYYRVQGTNTGGDSLWSGTQSAVVQAAIDPIINGDFEAGTAGWTQYASSSAPLIYSSSDLPPGVAPHSGNFAAWLGGLTYETDYIQQQIVVPASSPYLAYWHWIGSGETGCTFDFGQVVVNGTTVDSYGLCAGSNTGGWVKHVVNLSIYAGQSVAFQIRVQTDGSINSNLFVDDVAMQSTPSLLEQGTAVVLGDPTAPKVKP